MYFVILYNEDNYSGKTECGIDLKFYTQAISPDLHQMVYKSREKNVKSLYVKKLQ
jgi:hypothetical protein